MSTQSHHRKVMKHRYLRVFAALLLMFLVLFGTMGAKSKGNPDKLFKEGQAAEAKGDWDKALDLYLQALDLKPNDAAYMLSMRRARFQSGQKHVSAAQKARAEGKLEEALAEFQKALIADPSSAISIQEMKRTQEMIEQQKKGSATPDARNLTPIEQMRRANEQRMESILSPPELKPPLRSVGPLKINNQPPKVIYETVGKLAGVNVLFDSQFTPPNRNFNLDLSQSTPEQAFDYLAVLTHTFWKPISGNAIFVTEDNPTKHRDYDDEVVKTFYVTNATSAQEFQEIATAVRTVADIRRVFTYTAQKAMVIRGSLDAVALAEKVIHDLDKPKSEVIVDVIVMQANSSRTRDLAASLVNAATGSAGLNVPFVFTPRNPVLINGTSSSTTGSTTGTTTTGTTTTTATTGTTTTSTTTTTGTTGTPGQLVSLAGVRHISTNDFSTSLPGGLLNLMLTDNKTKVMNKPTVRASDGMKVELKIGQRIPYATGSFQPGVGTVGVSPLVSTQFNYADVGVNLVMTPQVHSNSEVTLHVEVEVSSVAQYVSIGGISQPVIGQNKNTADIRLREGEVSILGGLSTLQDSKTVNGIPGLVDMPVLGSVLFGSQHTDKESGELLIALIPHIVRTPDYTSENLRGIYAGNDNTVKLYYAPKPEPAAPAASAASAASAAQPQTAPAPQPTPAQPAQPAPATPPNPPAAPGQARVNFLPNAVNAAVSGNITVTLQLENAADLFSGSPIKIKFDPAQLRLNDIAPGELFTRDGTRVTSVKDIRNDTGEATLTVSRLPGSPGVSGSGAIAALNFVAIGKGSSSITISESSLKDAKQQPINVTLGQLPVKIE
jgi:general secretion pathway protein D